MKEIITKYPHLLHGGDYNPEQWIDCPQVLEEDIRLMKEAHVTAFPWGFFPGRSWSRRKGNSISAGCAESLTVCLKTAFTPSWPHPQAQCPTG